MASLFGVNIPAIVGSALGGGLLPATLTRVTPGARIPGSLASGTNATTTSHSARGVVSDYEDRQVDGTMVKASDRRVLLLAATISPAAVPSVGDRVAIEGKTYSVVRVTSDPASATYSLQVRNP